MLFGVSFRKAFTPFMRTLPSWPNHLPKAPPPDTITLALRLQRTNFVGTLLVEERVWSKPDAFTAQPLTRDPILRKFSDRHICRIKNRNRSQCLQVDMQLQQLLVRPVLFPTICTFLSHVLEGVLRAEWSLPSGATLSPPFGSAGSVLSKVRDCADCAALNSVLGVHQPAPGRCFRSSQGQSLHPAGWVAGVFCAFFNNCAPFSLCLALRILPRRVNNTDTGWEPLSFLVLVGVFLW